MIHLVRHGETEWSQTRRHTGTTDVPLTDHGRAQATALRPVLAELSPQLVLTSPLGRAIETCRLAGFAEAATVEPRLAEWDYGFAEGRTTTEIREEIPGWSVWTHPITDGESLESVGARVDSLIADLREVDGDVLLFAHAHLLRVLGARWCGLPTIAGRHFQIDPAGLSVLGHERETPTVVRWNLPT